MPRPFHIVDVFAEEPLTGNPLAVVIADDLPEASMQRIAAEINYSETTFVDPTRSGDGGYRMRMFTPASEVAFAGHPILGTAWVLRRYVAWDAPSSVTLELAVGRVKVSFELSPEGAETAWFAAPPVTLGPTCEREAMAAILGLRPDDIDDAAPVRQASAGSSAMIVPLRSLDALRRALPDLTAYAPLAARGFPPLMYLFCRETHHAGNDLCARFFFEAHGVREDPATGNGAAFLGAYLLEHRILPQPELYLRIEQGYEMRRPSLVRLRASAREIAVGGGVVPILRGELL